MTDKPLTILHSSDWHLGHTLMGRHRRHDEFSHFLDWLNDAITEHGVDVLLVSGDIFDSSIPSNAAQGLYFDFLTKVWRAGVCRHIVVIAGNHDSPTLLNAPASLLKALNIHVVGCMTERIEDEVVVLYDRNGAPELVVGAIPYLREQDIRDIGENESPEDKKKQLIASTRDHIRAVCDKALAQREKLATKPPMVVMGHLYSSGSSVAEGDGTRELYVGSLVEIGADAYSASCDYVALGHIHVPQAVGGKDFIRYSGSPLPMGFHEDAQHKGVTIVRFAPERSIEQLPVPQFRRLLSITGDREALLARVAELATSGDKVWLETIYNSTEPMGDLREQLEKAVAGSNTEILCTKTATGQFHALNADIPGESLEDLTPEEVFRRCLDSHEVPDDKRPALIAAYNEILQARQEADTQAVEGVEA